MKRSILIIISVLTCSAIKAQSAGLSDSAFHIAKKLQDTLLLSNATFHQLYNINMQLNLEKLMRQRQYSNNFTQMNQQVQGIESKRDSLYHTVLVDSVFNIYKLKKNRLIHSD